MFFCVKQKTAYELRISDWSSDVCSSDLPAAGGGLLTADLLATDLVHVAPDLALGGVEQAGDRKSVVQGKRVTVRLDLGGRSIMKKKKQHYNCHSHILRTHIWLRRTTETKTAYSIHV